MNREPATSEVEQDLQRAITNAQLQMLGVGVGSRAERKAVAMQQHSQVTAANNAICRQARDALQARPPRPMLAFCIQQALFNPGMLEALGTA